MSSKIGDAEGAQKWFDRMTSVGLKPTLAVANSLLDSYVRAKRFDGAKEILDSFKSWGLIPNLPTVTVCMRCLNLCESPEDLKLIQSMLSCHSGGLFLSELLGKSPEHDLAPVIASFLKSLHFERRLDRRAFINVLIDYLYKSGFRSQAYQVFEGALANYVFPGLVEQGQEAICTVNLRSMERGTAIIALTYTLPRLAKQFHRKEMTPQWVQIYTASDKDEIAIGDPTSVHQSIHLLLKTLHSPFHANTLQRGGSFVCRGEEVMYWLDEPEIRAMLAYKR
jgi:pentatricopeptide repeat protein